MRILYATAELAPLVRVGGLAEASSGLVRALRAAGADVDVVLPDYFGTELADQESIELDVAEWAGPAAARRGVLDGFGVITLVDVPGIRRPHPYLQSGSASGWEDNDSRFIAFSVAVAAIAELTQPDVVHVNDWHTAATAAFLPDRFPTVVSIHNLAYQGQCHIGWLDVFGSRSRAYELDGACNPLAGALRLADRILAVSPTYANEIRTRALGCGLHGLLIERGDAVSGILNGIDTGEWDPATDPNLASNYSVIDFGVADPATKGRCREELRSEFALDPADGPILGLVTRLVDQKGVDLALGLVPYLESVDAQLAVVGSGDPSLAGLLRDASDYHGGRVGFREGYDIGRAHRVFAGSDLYLMPSRFEPCGLAQMQAMAYGTIPLVTDVGGLHDTVVDADASADGNGFVSRAVDTAGLVDALHRASRGWANKRRRVQIIRRGMRRDWSWKQPAAAHAALYESLPEPDRGRRAPMSRDRSHLT